MYLPVPNVEDPGVTGGRRLTHRTIPVTSVNPTRNPYAWQQQDEQPFTLASIELTVALLARTESPFVDRGSGPKSGFVSTVRTDFESQTTGRVSDAITHQVVPGEPDMVFLTASKTVPLLIGSQQG